MLTAKKIKCRPRSVGQRNWAALLSGATTAPPPEKDPLGPAGPRLTRPKCLPRPPPGTHHGKEHIEILEKLLPVNGRPLTPVRLLLTARLLPLPDSPHYALSVTLVPICSISSASCRSERDILDLSDLSHSQASLSCMLNRLHSENRESHR